MLVLEIPVREDYNEETNQFVQETYRLELEHSLVSLSKWESKWGKPFLSTPDKTSEELLGYLKDMTLTTDVPEEIYGRFSQENAEKLNEYLGSKMTATWFREDPNEKPNREIITAEIIYNWMISLNVPLEFERRHLNQLLTLIRVCNQKNSPPKKMGRGEAIAQRNALNAQRRAQMKTSG